MASKMFTIERSFFGNDLATALVKKYGAGVTIHYQSATDVVFTCAAVCNKVLRISKVAVVYSSSEWFDQLLCQYGDAWTTGTTITNPVQFCGSTRTGSGIDSSTYITSADVILGDDFILIGFLNGVRDHMILVGKLTNGQFVACGFIDEMTYNANCHAYVIGTTTELYIPSMAGCGFIDMKPLIFPIRFVTSGSSSLLKNVDTTPATINGLYNIMDNLYSYSNSAYIGQTLWYTASNRQMFITPLYAPIELA